MIDLALLRKDKNYIVELSKRKDPSFDIEKLAQLDEEVRRLRLISENLRHEKNEIVEQSKLSRTDESIAKSRKISQDLKHVEDDLKIIEAQFEDLYLRCPNIIEKELPVGGKESNFEIKNWGSQPNFNFPLLNHLELGKLNNWFDFEAAAAMTGSQFALYKGDAVKLVYALMMYMFNNNVNHGFYPILPPYLVNEKALTIASNFPRFKEEVYAVEKDGLYLTPTSEVNLTNLYQNRILEAEQLPIRMTSWTSCFRREAGGYGAAERGLIRLHQFEKCELYTICEPEKYKEEQDLMLSCAENILQSLGLHYRIMLLAAQDCSFASAKTYDIEVWLPAQGIYKEISSISNCTDFQSRRALIRYKDSVNSKSRLVYTLNGSSLALPRLLVAIMETYQQEGGKIELPEVLKTIKINL